MNTYRAGIDIGSTTVKLVLLDEAGNILFGDYRRHHAHTQETLRSLLMQVKQKFGNCTLIPSITGSGSINLGKALDIPFVQEVVAVATALKTAAPQTDVAIELGGEDAKIIYFAGGLEERMNGVCAGGTGSFIDQMAALLQTDAAGLNDAAKNYQQIYPIAARCGVFAKTDIQPLINEGATKADLAASIFQAVVNQTISGLACGKPIRGTVAFLGGPLHFLTELKAAFVRTLKLTEETTVDPENSHLFAAMGAALQSGDGEVVSLNALIEKLEQGVQVSFEMPRLEPLFRNEDAYHTFCDRRSRAVVAKADISAYSGSCYLGIDAGSTTTKLVLIGENGELLWKFYANNQGNPIMTAQFAIGELKKQLPNPYRPLAEENAPRGTIGIPRVLNLYENYPFWATFFRELGFRVVLSPWSDRKIYELGMESIPSESECYPAKLSHGHVQWLIHNGIRTIFHPCVFFEHQETENAQNHYNCPIVVSYAENLKNNVEAITEGDVRYIRPFIAFTNEKTAADRLVKTAAEEWNIPEKEVRSAVHAAWLEQQEAKAVIREEGRRVFEAMKTRGGRGIVLAGRPYHIDPEINHGIPELIASYGLTVFTEDSLPVDDMSIHEIAEQTKPFLSIGNQYGEGWFLTGEMIELIKSGVPNIVCIQPFACLPNHVVGKGVIKALKKAYPQANIAAVDYDPGASEVNQLNRIKLMLSAAREQ